MPDVFDTNSQNLPSINGQTLKEGSISLIIQCPRCNYKNSKEGRFCNKCGLDLKQQTNDANIPKSSTTEDKEEGGLFSGILQWIRNWRDKREKRLARERQQWEYWQRHENLYPGGSSKSQEWRQLQLQILRRDHYRCVQCGREGRFPRRRQGQPFKPTGPFVGLHVHHVQPLSRGGTNNPANLRTLCINCHEAAHGRYLKGAR